MVDTNEHSLSNNAAAHNQVSQFARAWSRFKRHTLGFGAAIVVLLLIISSIFAPIVAPQDPNFADFQHRNEAPSVNHILGTDDLGRDMWARLIYGGRVSLTASVGAVAVYLSIGTVLGLISGYVGGKTDFIIQRITDVMMTFPSFFLILTFVSFTKPSLLNVILAIGLFDWPGICRLIRAEVLSTRSREFIMAAQCVGVPSRRILGRHILPNTLSPLIVTASYGLCGAILTETTLSFLGLGVPLPTPSWGNMISKASSSVTILEQMPWLWLSPGVAIVLCVLAFNFVGDGLRDALDPRLWQ